MALKKAEEVAAPTDSAKGAIVELILNLVERAKARNTSDEYKLHESIANLYNAVKE